MKLEDLKFGMICRLRNKGEIVILDDGSYYYELYKHRNYIINNYNEDFTHKEHDYFDIMEVRFGNEIISKREGKRWFIPRTGQIYYFVNSYGNVISNMCSYDEYDEEVFSNVRVFKTEEEAFKRLKEQQATLSVERWIAENDVEIKESNTKYKHFLVCYDMNSCKFEVRCYYGTLLAPKHLVLSSKENAEKLIKAREKELKIMLGVEE